MKSTRTEADLRALFDRRSPLEPWLDCGPRPQLSEVRSGKAMHEDVLQRLAEAAGVTYSRVLALYRAAVDRRVTDAAKRQHG